MMFRTGHLQTMAPPEKRMVVDPATGDLVFVDTELESEVGLPVEEPVPEISPEQYPAESDYATP